MENNSELYTADSEKALAELTGNDAVITGDQETDAYLMSLPPEERAAAQARIFAPPTGEELDQKVAESRFTYEPTYDEYLRIEEYRNSKQSEILKSIGQGWDMFTDVMSEAGKEIIEHPYDASIKLAPTIIEAALQSGNDMLGMITDSQDPSSPLFKWKSVLMGNDTPYERYKQYLDALRHHRDSERLFSGEDTILINKDFVNQKVKQAATFIVDPMTFSPMGIGGFMSKGARLVGLGEAMLKAEIKANAIKSMVIGGGIKVGLGVPLDIIGGAARNTIEYGARKVGQGLETIAGIPYSETSRMAKTFGIGTASAHVAGYSLPYAGGVATAWAGGTLVENAGQAIKMIGEKYIQQRGERGVQSFARQIITDSMRKNSGITLTKSAENLLRVIDKADPILSWTHDLAGGALHGAAIGGTLGGLTAGWDGFGHGIGLGSGLGMFGAGIGRSFSTIAGHQRTMREAVTAELQLGIVNETDPNTVRAWNRIRTSPSATPDIVKMINKAIVGVHSTTDNFKLTALHSGEYVKHIADTEGPMVAALTSVNGVATPEGMRPIGEFVRTDAYTYKRNSDGRVEVVVNMDNIFSPSKKYAGYTMAHEFAHTLFKHNVLGPHFEAEFRDMMLGVRNAEGVLTEGPMIPFQQVKGFFEKYNEAFYKWYGLEQMTPDDPRRQYYNQQYALAKNAIEKLSSEEVGKKTNLTEDEMRALYRSAEEFGAYNFSGWMNEMPMEFFLNGGELEGVQAVLHNLKSRFSDMLESRISPHEPISGYHKISKHSEFEVGMFNKGKWRRIGTLDYFFRDMIRATASLKNRGYIDLANVSEGYLQTLRNKGLHDIIATDERTGKPRIKTKRQIEEDRALKAQSISRILEAMPIEEGAGGMQKNAAGNWSGTFNENQLKALVQARIFTEEDASKIRVLQRAHLSPKDGTTPNVFRTGYFGESMGRSRTDDNDRVYGNKVAFKEREFILGLLDFEFGEDGTHRMNARVIDNDVIIQRAKEVWLDPRARSTWGDDFQAMMGDFYNVYLANLSKNKSDPTSLRMPTAQIFGGADGALKRDILHQIAGFAKSIDLPYHNEPLRVIQRGTMSSVMDLSLNRMIGLRTTGQSFKYDHQNAFWDGAANYKLDTNLDKWEKRVIGSGVIQYNTSGVTPEFGHSYELTLKNDKLDSAYISLSTSLDDVGERSILIDEKGDLLPIENASDFSFSQDVRDSIKANLGNNKKLIISINDALDEFKRYLKNKNIVEKNRLVQEYQSEVLGGLENTEPELQEFAKQTQETTVESHPAILEAAKKFGVKENNIYGYTIAEMLAAYIPNVTDPRQHMSPMAIETAIKALGFVLEKDSYGNFVLDRETGALKLLKNKDGNFVFMEHADVPLLSILKSAKNGNPLIYTSWTADMPSELMIGNKETKGKVIPKKKNSKDIMHELIQHTNIDVKEVLSPKESFNAAVSYGSPFRANRHLLDIRPIEEDVKKQPLHIRGMTSLQPPPSRMAMFGSKKSALVAISQSKTGAEFKHQRGNAFLNADTVVSVSGSKIQSLLKSHAKGILQLSALDFADAVAFLTRPTDLNNLYIRDIGRTAELLPSEFQIGQQVYTRDSGGTQRVEDANKFGKNKRLFSRDIDYKFNPIRPKRKTGLPVGRGGVDAWNIMLKGQEINNAPYGQGGPIRGDAYMAKLNTEQQMSLDYARDAIIRDVDAVKKSLGKRASNFVDTDIETDKIWKALNSAYTAKKEAERNVEPLIEEHEWNSRIHEQMRAWFTETKEAKIEERRLYWSKERYEKLQRAFSSIIQDSSEIVSGTIIDPEYRGSRSVANEAEAKLMDVTTRQLLNVLDHMEGKYDSEWASNQAEVLRDAGVTSPDELTDAYYVERYFENEGRIRHFHEIADPDNIDAIRAKIEEESGGLLSAEVVMRPNYEMFANSRILADSWRQVDEINSSPERLAEANAIKFKKGFSGKIKPRVTIVLGKKLIEGRDLIRENTSQNWRSGLYSSSADQRDAAFLQRITGNPELHERFNQNMEALKGAVEKFKQTAVRLGAELKQKQAIAKTERPDTYADYVSNREKRINDAIGNSVESALFSEIPRHSWNAGTEVDDIINAYVLRATEEAYADFFLAHASNGDYESIIKHSELNGQVTKTITSDTEPDMSIDIRLPDGSARNVKMPTPSLITNIIENAYARAKHEASNIMYFDTFKPNLPRLVREIIGMHPKGITAKKMIKELTDLHQKGVKNAQEVHYTGFGDWLKEQSKRIVSGKEQPIDPVEAIAFVDSTKLGISVTRRALLNMANDIESGKKYSSRGKIDDYGVISVKTDSRKLAPSHGGTHLRDTSGHTVYETIAHGRYTVRTDFTGRKFLAIDESQANNRMTERNAAQYAMNLFEISDGPEVQEAVSNYLKRLRLEQNQQIPDGDYRRLRTLLKDIGFAGIASTDKAVYEGTMTGSYSSDRTITAFSKLSRIASNPINSALEKRNVYGKAYNKAEISFARDFVRAQALAMSKSGENNISAINFAVDNYGMFMREAIENYNTYASGIMGYFSADPINVRKSTKTGKTLKNIEHYHGELSQQGRETLKSIMQEFGDKIPPSVISAWLQAQILACYDSNAMNKIYKDLYQHMEMTVESGLSPLNLDRAAIYSSADLLSIGFDALYSKTLRKYVGKYDSTESVRVFRKLLDISAKGSSMTKGQADAAFESLRNRALSPEDVAQLMPAFMVKAIEDGSSSLGDFDTVTNQWPTAPYNLGHVNNGGSSTVSLEGSATNAWQRLAMLSLYRKISNYIKVAGDSVLSGKHIRKEIQSEITDAISETYDAEKIKKGVHKKLKKDLWNPTADGKAPVYQEILNNVFGLRAGNTEGIIDGTHPYKSFVSHMEALLRQESVIDTFWGNQDNGTMYSHGAAHAPVTILTPQYNLGRTGGRSGKRIGSMDADAPSGSREKFWERRRYFDTGGDALVQRLKIFSRLADWMMAYSMETGKDYGVVRNSERFKPNRMPDLPTGAISMLRLSNEYESRPDMIATKAREIFRQYSDWMPNNDRAFNTGSRDTAMEIFSEMLGSTNVPVSLGSPSKDKKLLTLASVLSENLTSRIKDDLADQIVEKLDKEKLINLPEDKALVSALEAVKLATKAHVAHSSDYESVVGWMQINDVLKDRKSVNINNVKEIMNFAANRIPHIETQEWSKVMFLTMLKEAKLRGLDSVVSQHSHNGGATSSGLDSFKAEQLYDNQHKEIALAVARENKIPVTPNRNAIGLDESNPNWIKIKSLVEYLRDNQKNFIEYKPISVQSHRATKTPWPHLKKDVAVDLDAFALATGRGEGSVVLENSMRNINGSITDNAGKTSPDHSHALWFRHLAGISYGDRPVYVHLFQKSGDGILLPFENSIMRLTRDGYPATQTTQGKLTYSGDIPEYADKIRAINNIIFRTFISKDGLSGVSPDEISTHVDRFAGSEVYQSIQKDYPKAFNALDGLMRMREGLKSMVEYMDEAWTSANNAMVVAGDTELHGYRNWILRNRSTELELNNPSAEKVATNPNAMFKLNTAIDGQSAVTTGKKIDIGDWDWRNSFLGGLARTGNANSSARIQFAHEDYNDKVIGKIRIVPRVGMDVGTENGKAIEARALLDVETGLVIESYNNETIDPKWRKIVSEELESRMGAFGASDYSREPMASELKVPIKDVRFGIPERNDDDIPMAKLNSSQEQGAKLSAPKPEPVSWEKRPVGNGTAFTSLDGYFISVTNRRFRLYNVNRELVGVFNTEEEAKKKAETLNKRKKP